MDINEFIKAHGPLYVSPTEVVVAWVPPTNGSSDPKGSIVVSEAQAPSGNDDVDAFGHKQ